MIAREIGELRWYEAKRESGRWLMSFAIAVPEGVSLFWANGEPIRARYFDRKHGGYCATFELAGNAIPEIMYQP